MRSIFTLSACRIMLAFFIGIFSVQGVDAQTHTPKTVSINAACGGYYEYLPYNYSSTSGKYPVLIYISGGNAAQGNGTASSMEIILNQGVPRVIDANLFPKTFTVNGETTSFIVISPQFRYKPSPVEVNSFIDYIVNAYPRIDRERICLTGFSIGGDVAWKTPYDLASASRLAALVPVAGYNNPYSDENAQFIAAAKLPVWAIHSNADEAPVAWTIGMVNKINSYNPAVPPVLTRPEGLSHVETHQVVYEPTYKPLGLNIYEWCLQFRRASAARPPVANAGTDKTIVLPVNNVTLTGSATDPDGGTLKYAWTRISGPSAFSIASASSASTAVTGLTAGEYQFQLQVTDPTGLSAKDTVKVTVQNAPNQLPVANAGSNASITLPANSVTLNASGSSDADGNIASYSWTKISGPAAFTINNAAAINPVVSGLTAGTYSIQLTVTDDKSATAKDTVLVIVNPAPNQPPVANAGSDVTITLPQSNVTLNGNASSDPDGNIASYSWTKISGPASFAISNANVVSPVISNLTAGTYSIQLTVTDNNGATNTDLVSIIVNSAANQLPVANAGADQSITLPVNTVSLNGNASSDPDGSIVAYQWAQVAGPSSGNLSNATSATATAGGLVEGTYRFELTVRDNDNATSKATVQITVDPAPSSGGGTGRVIQVNLYSGSNPAGTGWNNWNLSSSLTLSNAKYADGTSSGVNVNLNISNAVADNGNNYPVTMCPAQVGRSASYSTVMRTLVISGLDNAKQYELEVYSSRAGSGNTTKFTLGSKVINVLSSNNYVNSALFGNVTPTSGQIKLIIERLNTYNYINGFTLRELGGQDEEQANEAPVANAGADQQIQLPASSLQLNGSGTDSDGTIASYQWLKVSGPASGSINNAAIANPLISDLSAGTYVFELTVTDNKGATAKDAVVITVNAVPNVAPVANAGSDQSVNLPVNTVSLNGGSSADNDGSIVSYQWKQVSGPSTATLNNLDSAVASATNLVQGIYRFELTVRDNDNAEAKDAVTITVNPPLLSERDIRVNLYAGANPAGSEWNNWNVQSSLSYNGLKYSDGTASSVSVSINVSNAIADNGTNYPVTMCPAEVGRTTSYSTVARFVTLTGLDNTKRYEIEVYGSRNGTGNSTKFTIGSTSINVVTDRNYSNKAVFSNLAPAAGQLVLKVERLNTYNYINGFIIREIGSEQSLMTSRSASSAASETSDATIAPLMTEGATGKVELGTYPNPFVSNLDLQVNNDKKGMMSVVIVNQSGLPVKQMQFAKEQGMFRRSIALQDLQPGVYFLKVQMQGWTKSEKIVKMN